MSLQRKFTVPMLLIFAGSINSQQGEVIYFGELIFPLRLGMQKQEVLRLVLGDGRYTTPDQLGDEPNALITVVRKNTLDIVGSVGFNEGKLTQVGRDWERTEDRAAIAPFTTLLKLLEEGYKMDSAPTIEVKSSESPDRTMRWARLSFQRGSDGRTITFSVSRSRRFPPQAVVDDLIWTLPASRSK